MCTCAAPSECTNPPPRPRNSGRKSSRLSQHGNGGRLATHSRTLYPKAQQCPIVPEELSRNARHNAVPLVGESGQIPLAQVLCCPLAIPPGWVSSFCCPGALDLVLLRPIKSNARTSSVGRTDGRRRWAALGRRLGGVLACIQWRTSGMRRLLIQTP